MDENQIKKELSIRIKSYRKAKRLTQDAFAPLIGFEQNNFSRLERGRTMPDTSTICKLIEDAGIEANYLFGFLNNKNKNFNTIDFEIIEHLINLPTDCKEYFLNFLKTMK